MRAARAIDTSGGDKAAEKTMDVGAVDVEAPRLPGSGGKMFAVLPPIADLQRRLKELGKPFYGDKSTLWKLLVEAEKYRT